jgi:WD40 repeat protein
VFPKSLDSRYFALLRDLHAFVVTGTPSAPHTPALTLVGRSAHRNLVLIDLPLTSLVSVPLASVTQSPSIPPPRLFRNRPSERIRKVTRSPRGAWLLSIGTRGELTLWSSKRRGTRVLTLESHLCWHASSSEAITKVAIWDDGQRVVAHVGGKLLLLRPDTSKFSLLGEFEGLEPSDQLHVLMPITLSRWLKHEGHRILVAATASGRVLVWRVRSSGIDLVHRTSDLMTPPPQAFIAFDDALGDLDPGVEHATIGTVSQAGDICFWTLQLSLDDTRARWVEGGRVKTGRTPIRLTKASAGKKTALGELVFELCASIYDVATHP